MVKEKRQSHWEVCRAPDVGGRAGTTAGRRRHVGLTGTRFVLYLCTDGCTKQPPPPFMGWTGVGWALPSLLSVRMPRGLPEQTWARSFLWSRS